MRVLLPLALLAAGALAAGAPRAQDASATQDARQTKHAPSAQEQPSNSGFESPSAAGGLPPAWQVSGPDGRRVPLWYREGRAGLGDYAQLRVTTPYRPRRADPYVAVLLGDRTASSGEIVAAAFRGSPRHRFFGVPTSGLATGNKSFTLSDGATLVLAVAATSDRTGDMLLGPLEPDEATPDAAPERAAAAPATSEQSAHEPRAIERAASWLRGRCESAESSADEPETRPSTAGRALRARS
ncbi:MAG TPA: S41 family peptidase [Gammaproteobacteria bacterium]|nr:S41 family peptidase [Gammaproteobacteria bacterium]